MQPTLTKMKRKNNLPYKKNAYKLLWFGSIFLCTIPCIVHVTVRLHFFFEDPVTVDVVMKPSPKVRFPGIVLCSDEFISLLKQKVKMCSKPNTGTFIYGTKMCDWNLVGNFSANDTEDAEDRMDKLTQININKISIDQYRPFFQERSKERIPIVNQSRISYIDTLFGQCLVVVLEKEKYFRGANTWISLSWNSSTWIKDLNNDTKNNAFIYVEHDKYVDISHHKLMRKGEAVISSYSYTIRISAIQNQAQNTRQKPCTDRLTFEQCINKCVDNTLCGATTCRLPFMQNNCSNSHQDCKTFSETLHSFIRADFTYAKFTPSNCSCKRPCNSFTYKMRISNKELNENGETSVKFVYSDNMLIVYTETLLFPISELLSEIGGILGLYLGVCFLNVCNMINEFFARNFHRSPQKRRNKQFVVKRGW